MESNSSNDMHEDFQFRPITEGLGFQKKRGLLANKATLSSPLPRSENKKGIRPSSVLPQTPPPTRTPVSGAGSVSASGSGPSGSTPISRTAPSPASAPTPTPSPVSSPSPAMEKVLNSMARRRNLDFVNTRAQSEKTHTDRPQFQTEKTQQIQILRRPAVYAVWSLPAAFFDMMVVAALSLTAIIILVGVTHLDLLASINNSDKTVLMSLATLVAGVSFIYPVVGRVFAGMTLGEWVFELQTGSAEVQKKTFYGIRVLFRGLLVMATGVVVLPFLSLIFRTDLAGKMTGVRLVKRPQ